jgi:hypothetical protein
MSRTAALLWKPLPTSVDWWSSAKGLRICFAVNGMVAIGVDYLLIRAFFGV